MGFKLKTLNVIYICRVGLAVLAALIATLVVDLKVGDPLINGITIFMAVYLLTYYGIKYVFMSKVDNQSKLLTMGIGAYFLTFLLCWTLFTTLTLALPTATFTVDDQTPAVGQTITFDASLSEDSDGEIVTYTWNFGDNSTAEEVNPTHSYDAAGEYVVTLTVVDDHGLSSSNSTTLTVAALG